MTTALKSRTLELLYNDIETAAQICGVTPIKEQYQPVMSAYESFFTGSAVAMRTTSHPVGKRDLDVRYVDTVIQYDPYPLAVEKGFLTPDGHPVYNAVSALNAELTFCGYGVDVSVTHGLRKIWPFMGVRTPVEDVCAVAGLPDSVRNVMDYYKKYDLATVSLLAVDYGSRTVNLYFFTGGRPLFSPEKVAGQIADAGFEVPGEDEILTNATAASIYLTFNWESSEIVRLSYVLPVPLEHVPIKLPEHLLRFTREAPTYAEQRRYIYNTAYTHTETYTKMEVDYTATMGDMLQKPILVA
ncbi:MAG TPA: aromatic prenyltransferase [Aggregatilinea sp.]|uniref:aromatic prenyltransferase n=1 Tax=Aggregatilinea sp. TaxID=2806333 RepID=UPI002C36F70E|nr:aromatic prenyltransferase [Aggregatilinea sp.]HML23406.1 aromatic prenyltransferase [Aggregatilinea sp.]